MAYCRICGVYVHGKVLRCDKCRTENDELRNEVIHYAIQLIQQDEMVNSIFWDLIKENRPPADKRNWDYLTHAEARKEKKVKP